MATNMQIYAQDQRGDNVRDSFKTLVKEGLGSHMTPEVFADMCSTLHNEGSGVFAISNRIHLHQVTIPGNKDGTIPPFVLVEEDVPWNISVRTPPNVPELVIVSITFTDKTGDVFVDCGTFNTAAFLKDT